MSTNFKPEGYNSVSPYFILKDAEAFIKLLETIFEAKLMRRFDRPDGKIMHAEVKIDDSIIMLSEATDKYPPLTLVMHVYVKDAKATFEKALAAGCQIEQEPKQADNDPDLRGTFVDFAGNMWSVGQQL